jgi:hypothetical protein
MSNCDKVADILKSCDSAILNLASGILLVRIEALNTTFNSTNQFLLDGLTVVDPNTGLYPAADSVYKPIKAEWLLNSVTTNYEVVEGTSRNDSFAQTIGPVVISNSETALGKQTIKGLNANLWVAIAKIKGAAANTDSFHVYGVINGLKFLPQATSPEFGNRVVGTFKSVAGAEESTPNGVNLLMTSFANTNTLFNQRFNPVIV